MKLSLIACLACLSIGCVESERKEIAELKAQETQLTGLIESERAQLHVLEESRTSIGAQVNSLQNDARVLQAMKDGKGVHYVLNVSLRQVHYSINITKQLADMANEEEFDMVTDKDNYDRINVGDDLFRSFRAGSLMLKGSAGEWRLKVTGKRIATDS